MSLKKFIKRLRYLSTEEFIDNIVDNLKYEIIDEIKSLPVPKIMSVDETLDILVNEKKSICRFGDGELNLISGENIPFKSFDTQLQQRLIEVLSSANEQIMIGIPRVLFQSKQNITAENINFWRKKGKRFRSVVLPYLDMNRQFYSAEVTLAYSYYVNYDIKTYFAKFRQLWHERDIVIITGKTVFNNITYNIFDNAASVEYIYAPSRNAFAEYEKILQQALNQSKHKIIIAILGPTAKPLCYDLALHGYQALDLGHIAKSYDFYRKNLQPNDKNANFFSPD